MRIAISTGGGDAPGLNAVIRAVVLSAHHRGWRSYGILRGYDGLLSFSGVVPLGPNEVRGITHIGGTILGTTNRGNPFRQIVKNADGTEREVDRSDELVAAFQASGFDALVSIGGDGSLSIAYELWKKGIPVVCVPKTIDNDVSGTQRSFGYDSAVSTARRSPGPLITRSTGTFATSLSNKRGHAPKARNCPRSRSGVPPTGAPRRRNST